ncbi:CLUMA_CG021493, isoform A [Clunio marinus]|uniref:CLUMA_CG021493, isoform A n=1 Tax=Clunio marinus TaxID=568069 RepID=A0A1J1J7E3_9DIPT|nr:CLUMA_CG021493, isoform A [Clunio marinus]
MEIPILQFQMSLTKFLFVCSTELHKEMFQLSLHHFPSRPYSQFREIYQAVLTSEPVATQTIILPQHCRNSLERLTNKKSDQNGGMRQQKFSIA